MHFDLLETSSRTAYHLLIGLVAPRPIALVTSLDLDGRINAAPFSAFNYLGHDPALVAIGVGNRPDSVEINAKDTARNIRQTREFVVNIVSEALAEGMNVCAVDFPPGVEELSKAGFSTAPSRKVKVPRIKEAPAALECREHCTIEIGRSRVVIGVVESVFVQDEYVDPAGPYIRAENLGQIGRMNGLGGYVTTRDWFMLKRMNLTDWQEVGGKAPSVKKMGDQRGAVSSD